MSIKQRIEDAAGEYDKWPRSMKEAFRLSTVVDRIPPTLQHGVALLGEIDRLESLLTAANARISELTQCDPSWFDASPADAFRMWAEDKKRLTAATERAEKAESQRDRMREALEKYGRHGRWCRFFEDDVIDCQCGLSRVLKEVGDE